MVDWRLRAPSWRGAFFMLLSFVLVSGALWSALFVGAANAEARFVDEWRDLFTRCRLAIENRTYPATDGLTEVPVSRGGDAFPTPGNVRYWARPNGRFVLSEADSGTGPVSWRRCDVRALDDTPLSLSQQMQLAAAFREIEFGLIVSGTHIQAQAAVLGNTITDMFIATKLNSAGCEVVAMITMSEGTYRLPALVGERGNNCLGPPLGLSGADAT